MKKKICVFTGTRAEYGLLKPLMEKIADDVDFNLQLIASGMHMSPEFGLTYKEIEKDGFQIDEKIDILLSSDTTEGISKSVGLGLISYSDTLKRLKPDIVIILGDRFEAFSMAVSGMLSRIPIVHLQGGEATYGLIDEAIRHSITKMSYLHFTSTEEYRKRIIQLGENPDRVFAVGALGLDNIKHMKLITKKELELRLDFEFAEHNLLITFHPVTLEFNTSQKQFQVLLDVVDKLKNTKIIFTKANADMEGRIINKLIDEYTQKNTGRSKAFTSMGQLLFLSTLQFVDAVVGNSSGGIIEAPSFKIGSINIGDRQKGRISAKSVIDCEPTGKGIKDALRKLYSGEFQKILKTVRNPYGDGNAAGRIIKILKTCNINGKLKKTFYDI